MPYPSRKIRRIRACTHQRPRRKQDQYVVSSEDQYAVLEIQYVDILEDIKRGPYSKKHPIRGNRPVLSYGTGLSCSSVPDGSLTQMEPTNVSVLRGELPNFGRFSKKDVLSSNHSMYYGFREAFHRLFDANEGLFRSVLSRNMQNLEMQFSNETLHEKDSNSELRAIKGQFEHFMHSKMFVLSKYNTNRREKRDGSRCNQPLAG
ncbi:hypothetical protein Tco_1428167 [Tanacetum coccineum]